ncbi:UNKNOWN [Stylonychia lemnae]|uniref:Transmembrane protein n=1 Tax=Stylonychia lemnae TaxID=5949 RepID=A0A078AXR1_STYLE|nr:UNKNOWN [Stylonychia lemnae]|eukprot:CDW85588.1 UNKNOWN [Stylonychia lemnae]
MVYITLIPFDVYNAVNHYKTVIFNIDLYTFYLCDYIILIGLCFIVLPFTYFYAEESLENEDDIDFFSLGEYSDDDEEFDTISTGSSSTMQVKGEKRSKKHSLNQRLKQTWTKAVISFKKTSLFIGGLSVLLIVSYFLQNTVFRQTEENEKYMDSWKKQIFDTNQYGETFVRFIVTLMIFIGAIFKLLYNSYGMASMPLLLIKGQKSLEDERDAISKSIEQVREQLRAIQEKYQKSHEQVSRKDKQALRKLRKDEKMLNTKSNKIESTIQRCLSISLLIISSIVAANIDKLLNSTCGFHCGYFIDKYTLFNPLDWTLVQLSKVFPLDLIFISIILIYVLVTCIFGIVRLGVRFMQIFNVIQYHLTQLHQGYTIKKRETQPQALNLAAVLIILMVFAFSMQLMTISPQYTTFGSQRLEDGTPCGLEQNQTRLKHSKFAQCEMTEISSFYNKILLSMPLFSIAYYFLSWIFVTTFTIFLLYSLTKKAEKNFSLSEYNEDEILDLKSFIGKSSSSGKLGLSNPQDSDED